MVVAYTRLLDSNSDWFGRCFDNVHIFSGGDDRSGKNRRTTELSGRAHGASNRPFVLGKDDVVPSGLWSANPNIQAFRLLLRGLGKFIGKKAKVT